jgi:hypothetical protein
LLFGADGLLFGADGLLFGADGLLFGADGLLFWVRGRRVDVLGRFRVIRPRTTPPNERSDVRLTRTQNNTAEPEFA